MNMKNDFFFDLAKAITGYLEWIEKHNEETIAKKKPDPIKDYTIGQPTFQGFAQWLTTGKQVPEWWKTMPKKHSKTA